MTQSTAPAFTDISVELYRTYQYTGGGAYTIKDPVKLYITENGGHRVVDFEGVTHAPARPWLAITWKQADGKPFSF